MTPASSLRGAVVIDANIAVAICAKEPTAELKALEELGRYSSLGYEFYAPGVLVSESLYVLCGKREGGTLSTPSHTQAITDLVNLLTGVLPPPNGEASLVRRAEAIRGTLTCRRSADGLYLALAEELAATRPTVLLTLDRDMSKQARNIRPAVSVRLLTV